MILVARSLWHNAYIADLRANVMVKLGAVRCGRG